MTKCQSFVAGIFFVLRLPVKPAMTRGTGHDVIPDLIGNPIKQKLIIKTT